ncbi:MAG: LytR/AlgR family response regulator transcription factor [Leadbetterella sp.]
MKVIIFEDEPLSARRLQDMLHKLDTPIEVLEIFESIEEGLQWFQQNPEPDMIFLDIHLSDGTGFELLAKVKPKAPIIFVTAYDQYAIQAFKTNSVDYLLKPLDFDSLRNAFVKFSETSNTTSQQTLENLLDQIKKSPQQYKNRFLVKFGDSMLVKTTEDIAYFYSEDKYAYLVDKQNKTFLVDYTLETLESILNPQNFTRLNRKVIVAASSVQKLKTLLNRRIQVYLEPPFSQEVYIAKERVSEVKDWLNS